jgi:bla regulator protein blaR1
MNADLLHVLVVSTLASSAAIALVLALRKPLRKRFGARAAYALWSIVPLVAAVALLPAPVAPVPLPSATTAVAQILAPLAGSLPAQVWHFYPQPWIAALWLAGVACSTLWLARRQRRFVRALGRLVPDGDRLRAQTSAGCPALVGAWRPRIVVPADFEQRFDAAERDLILAHERLHRAHGDAQINLIAAVLRCLFWFNPLVHYAASRLRFDQELACDARVIARFPEARRLYADAMLKAQLADESRQEPGLPVGCYWQSSHPLKERITMLKHPLPGRTRSALGLLIATALTAGGTYAAWATQPQVPAAMTSATGSATPPSQDRSGEAGTIHATYRSMRRIAYPAAQLAAKTQGVVYVNVRVGADGNAASVSVDRVDPQSAGALAAAAVAGVRTWRFNPAERNARPVASDEIIPIVFALRPDAVPSVSGGTLDAIRVAPPDEPGAASADHPPTENVTYRSMHPPKYPEDAVRDKKGGELQFKVLVDEHGVPQSVDVARSDPPEAARLFAQASIEAIMQWRFNPGLKHGKPAAGYVLVPITFALSDE